ncbi:MAG TPA: LOG family protein [Bacteroidota bacterium]|nr:LOG family protein [Bacteroidota bacterium]
MKSKSIITIFGSSRPRDGDPEYNEARVLGGLLATAGYVVCNGGYGGTMGASARGAKESGGRTIGVVSEYFSLETNRWVDKKIEVKSLVDRLMELVSLADGYIVLKGGTGTLLELASVWEFMNKSVIEEKPIVVLGTFWNGVIDSLKQELVYEGKESCTKYISVASSPQHAVELLQKSFSTPLS